MQRYMALNLDDEVDSAELQDWLNEHELPGRRCVAVFTDPAAYADTVKAMRSQHGTAGKD